MERSVDYLKELVTELKIDCDYEHPGFLKVATSEKYKERILKELEMVNKLGLGGIEWLEKQQLHEQVRSPSYLGASWEPRCGILNPAKLSWGWADVIKSREVEVYENTPVIALSKENGKVCLDTPNGHVQADKVVMATNAWSHFFKNLKLQIERSWLN